MTGTIRKAVLPVGGLGTRFLPVTKAIPKEMLPVVDKPLIQYGVEEARQAGIEEIIFVTSRGKAAIEDHFDHHFELMKTLEARGKTAELELARGMQATAGKISYTRQPEALGLGHAVWCARNLVGREPFAVILPDDLVLHPQGCLAQLVEAYGKVGGNLVAVEDVPREHTNRYGILDVVEDAGVEKGGRLVKAKGLVEKPEPAKAPSTLSIIGRYILQPEVFDELDRQDKGAGGEIQLTDAMARTIGSQPFHGLRFEGRRFDCGSKAGFLEANLAYALERDDLRDTARDIVRRYGAEF
jgi:UTP--glucose-1-phosphate uridylyltransferase